ncbi:MAG: hypothetical protein Q9219_007086 [cf. Caloplaca sp. 3 TL-2023]
MTIDADSNKAEAFIKGPESNVKISSLKTRLCQSVKQYGNRDALVCLPPSGYTTDGPAQKVVRWTYGQLYTYARALADWLRLRGVKRGDCIVAFLTNEPGFALALWAAALLRACFVPLDWRIAQRTQDIKDYLSTVSPTAVLVTDNTAAQAVDDACTCQNRQLKARIATNEGSETVVDTWAFLNNILGDPETGESVPEGIESEDDDRAEDIELIIFTSGTTGSPKGCPHTTRNLSHTTPLSSSSARASDFPALVLTPAFHQMGLSILLRFWCGGAKVVMPTSQLEATTIRDVIADEAITVLCTVPTIIQTLIDLPKASRAKLSSLVILIGGAIVPSGMFEACKDPSILGTKAAFGVFGMSEASSIFMASVDTPVTIRNGFASVGRVQADAIIKICDPDTGKILKRGETGELHVGGPRVIERYLASSRDRFYTDEDGSNWMATGDQAVLDDAGNAFILGRYKDLIIRAGENIAPAAIEGQLAKIPAMREVHVVGIADDVAGELPAAVVQMDFGCQPAVADLRRHVAAELGSTYAPEVILTFDELGLVDVPRTAIGKVKKGELRVMVQDHLEHASGRLKPDKTSIETAFATIWSHLLLEPVESLVATSDILGKADSLGVLRFQSLVKRQYGKTISLQDLQRLGSIRQQAEYFEGLQAGTAGQDTAIVDQSMPSVGPPSLADMAHVNGDQDRARRTSNLAGPILGELGLDWDSDVEAVLPVPDSQAYHCNDSRPHSYLLHMSLSSDLTEETEFRHAIETSLCTWPILRSVYLYYDSETQLYLIIRSTPKWNSLVIDQPMDIDSIDDLSHERSPVSTAASSQGPLLRLAIFRVKDTGKIGATIRIHHLIYDAFSLTAWLQDVKSLISGAILPPSSGVPYKHYADMYYHHRNSAAADESVKYHRNRMKGLADLQSYLWPPLRAPGTFIGNDGNWKHSDGNLGKTEERRPLNADRDLGIRGVTTRIDLTGIQTLKTEHGISPDIVLKAGCAVFNMQTTERIQPSPTQSTLSFLQSLRQEQKLLTQHAQAPLSRIERSLSEADGAVFAAMGRGQSLDWNGAIQGLSRAADDGSRSLQILRSRGHTDATAMWDCGLLGPEEAGLTFRYDDCQLSQEEATEALEGFKICTEWVCKSDHWARSVTEALEDIKVSFIARGIHTGRSLAVPGRCS